jgi:hypothetical protein
MRAAIHPDNQVRGARPIAQDQVGDFIVTAFSDSTTTASRFYLSEGQKVNSGIEMWQQKDAKVSERGRDRLSAGQQAARRCDRYPDNNE